MPPSEAWEQCPPACCSPSVVLSFGFGYLLGSIPFGLILAKLAGLGDVRADRLRQYRRDQCVAHRQQGACAAPRCCSIAEGHRRRAGWGRISGPTPAMACRARRLSRPSLSGLARLSRRQGRGDLSSACCSGSTGLPRVGVLRDLADRGLRHALFLARCAGGERGKRRDARADRPVAARGAVPAAHRSSLRPPRLEYRAAGERRGGAHWREDRLRARPSRRARAGSTVVSASPGSA